MRLALNSGFVSISSRCCRCFFRDIFTSERLQSKAVHEFPVFHLITFTLKVPGKKKNISDQSTTRLHKMHYGSHFRPENNFKQMTNVPTASFSNRPKFQQLNSWIIFHQHVSLANSLKYHPDSVNKTKNSAKTIKNAPSLFFSPSLCLSVLIGHLKYEYFKKSEDIIDGVCQQKLTWKWKKLEK